VLVIWAWPLAGMFRVGTLFASVVIGKPQMRTCLRSGGIGKCVHQPSWGALVAWRLR
jgi:hypothetical protein